MLGPVPREGWVPENEVYREELPRAFSLVFFSILSYGGPESQLPEHAQEGHMLANGATQIMMPALQPR